MFGWWSFGWLFFHTCLICQIFFNTLCSVYDEDKKVAIGEMSQADENECQRGWCGHATVTASGMGSLWATAPEKASVHWRHGLERRVGAAYACGGRRV